MCCGDPEAAGGGEGGNEGDRAAGPGQVGDAAGDEAADDEAGVAPEAVDADCLGAVARLDGVRDGGDQARVDHRGASAEQDGGGERRPERAAAGDEQAERAGLDEHAERDQRLTAGVVGEPAGGELAEPPDGRVDGSDGADLRPAGAVRGQIERREAPGQRVVQVVDQPGL